MKYEDFCTKVEEYRSETPRKYRDTIDIAMWFGLSANGFRNVVKRGGPRFERKFKKVVPMRNNTLHIYESI